MGIKDLFDTEAPRSRQQDNWLKMVAAIPGAKRVFGDPVIPEDEVAAAEAQAILNDGAKSKQAPKCLRDERYDQNEQGPCSAGQCRWPDCKPN